MALGDIVVKLDLDGRGFNSKLAIARKDLDAFAQSIGRSNSAVKANTGVVRTWGRTLRDSFIVLGLARSALHNVVSVLNAFPRAVISANARLEMMRALMIGLDTDSRSMSEAVEGADKNIQKLFKMSSASPFDVEAVTNSFVKMKAAGIDPLAGALQGLVDSVAKFGGSSQQLNRASIAIQQMVGKGVISMEELRQQLGEAVPNAMQVMSRATGMEIGKMVKIISEGRLEAQSALEAFFKQLQIESAGSAAALAKTWTGSINRLKNEWTLFLKTVGDSGGFDAAVDSLNELIDALQTREFRAFAVSVGTIFSDMVRGLVSAIKWMYEWRDAIQAVAIALIALKASAIVIPRINSAIGTSAVVFNRYSTAIDKVVAKQAAYTGGAHAAYVATASFSKQTSAATKLISAAGLAIRGFARAIYAALGPIGLIIIALEGIIYFANRARIAKEKLSEALEMPVDLLTPEQIETNRKSLETLRKQEQDKVDTITRLRAKLSRAESGLASGTAFEQGEAARAARAVRASIDAALAELAQIQSKMVAQGARIDSAVKSQISDQAKSYVDTWKGELQSEMQRLQGAFKDSNLALAEELANAQDISSDERAARFAEGNRKNTIAFVEAQIALTNTLVEEKRKQLELDKQSGEVSKEQAEAQEQALAKMIEGARDLKLHLAETKINLIDNADKAATAFGNKLASLNTRIADYNARIADTGSETAKLAVWLENNTSLTSQQVDQLKSAGSQLDVLLKKWKNINDARTTITATTEVLDKMTGSVETLNARAENSNNKWIKLSGSAAGAAARIREAVKQLEEAKAKTTDIVDLARIEEQLGRAPALIKKAELAVATAGVEALKNATLDYQETIMSTGDAAASSYQRQAADVREFMQTHGHLLGPEAQRISDNYIRTLELQRDRAADAILDLGYRWQQETSTMSTVWASGISDMTDEMAEFIVTGEANFQGFLNNLMKMIVKFMLQKMVAQFLTGFMPDFGSFGGGSSGSTSSSAPAGGSPFFAQGGIMTNRGSMALKKYSKGGIATRPQIAMFGEGDQNEAYVPLPDGRSIPVTLESSTASSNGPGNVTVNLFNESGEQLDATPGTPKFDGERFVMDIVLKNLGKPGRFRDALRG